MSYDEHDVQNKRQRYSPSAQDYLAEDREDEDDGSHGESSRVSSTRRPLEPSILNAEPWDEVMRTVADWIHANIHGKTNIEIEGKVGRIIDTSTGKRLVEILPIRTETILSDDRIGIRFEADMSKVHHQKFNQMLNQLHASYSRPDYKFSRIDYKHERLVDSFYALPGGGTDKLRVTRDARTGQTKESIVKQRIANLNVLCPGSLADWRVSVNIEDPVPQPSAARELYQRQKDRLSYVHQDFRIDLTQVKSQGDSEGDRTSHELEIEFANPVELMSFAAARGNESSPECDTFDEMVRIFVNNCRVMVRNL
ncbi:mRNA triphosphatase CET1 [Auriculariales sp. MPI-PUGE-AT-0066]|nr:mRNA triphosphatase CET1 [Auriculariales sp. MPI-PUGE-AT-0066]